MARNADLLCPSASPDIDGAVIFGVVSHVGGRPRVEWLEEETPVTPDILALTGDTPPTQVLRIAAKCQESLCTHFEDSECQLVGRLVTALGRIAEERFPCAIRGDCRWFWQESYHACERCSQIATHDASPDTRLREAALPRVPTK